MRYAVILIAVLAVFCTGCAQAGYTRLAPAAQMPGISRGAYLPTAAYRSYDRPDRLAVGLTLGDTYSYAGEAVEGFRYSDFDGGSLTGFNLLYTFPVDKYTQAYGNASHGGLELRIDEYSMLLSEGGFKFGNLNLTTTVLALEYLWIPPGYELVGFHTDFGVGWGDTSFTKHAMLKANEAQAGYYTKISPGIALVASFGIGVDFYITPEFGLSLDFRRVDVILPVDWYENGILRTDIDYLYPSNYQLLLTFRYFF